MRKISLAVLALGLSACPATDDTEEDTDTTGDVSEEPNDTLQTAYEVTLPAEVEASIDPSRDKDWFTFDASSDVTVSITAVDAGLELYIDVVGDDESVINSWDTGSRGATFSNTFTVSEVSTYYVEVESAYVDDTGDYTIDFK